MIYDGPINDLSLGNVSLNIIRELVKRNKIKSLFPVGDNVDFSAYDKLDPKVRSKIVNLIHGRIKGLNKELPTLKMWHLKGSERKLSDKQYLYTFYETDSPTIEEITIAAQQEHVFFSSSESAEFFKKSGLDNVSYIPIGFDKDFHKTNKKYLDEDVIHFGLAGKWEKRKNTERIIKLWLEQFGNNKNYLLTCLVDNPFFKKEVMDQLKIQAMSGEHHSNINFLPHLKTNSEVNQFYNAIDIDLTGLSSGEGWNLPAFNATALGKWSVVSNCSAHKDWANKDNSILVEVDGKVDSEDGAFFKNGTSFNQGKFYNITDESIVDGFERSLKFLGKENKEGEKLQYEFSYEKTVDKIESVIYN